LKTDLPHILCVNPWVHDFAAFDFWAKPLGLLSIAAVLRKQGIRISFMDCLDRFHPEEEQKQIKRFRDGRGFFRKTPIDLPRGLEDSGRIFSRYGIKPSWFEKDLKQMEKPDLIFVTSLMTYWAGGVKETIEQIKSVYPDVPLVLGGIYASLCHDHACKDTQADLVVKGSGEPQLGKIIKQFTGFELDDKYLSGNLDDLPWPALDLSRKMTYAPIATSRGCPFSCEYCASSFLEPELRRRSAENVFNEILHWHQNYKIKNFAFYDDALLINAKEYAFPLFEKIIARKLDLCFHTPNALHVREITGKAARLMSGAGFKNIRLGLETTDFSAARHLDHKVSGTEFIRAVENLKSAGFEKKQLGAYLLCGLPGQDLDEVKASMQFVQQTGIMPVLAYYTPIPHTALWETAVKHSRYNLLEHPVFTNNTLFPCVNSPEDLLRISQLKNMTI